MPTVVLERAGQTSGVVRFVDAAGLLNVGRGLPASQHGEARGVGSEAGAVFPQDADRRY